MFYIRELITNYQRLSHSTWNLKYPSSCYHDPVKIVPTLNSTNTYMHLNSSISSPFRALVFLPATATAALVHWCDDSCSNEFYGVTIFYISAHPIQEGTPQNKFPYSRPISTWTPRKRVHNSRRRKPQLFSTAPFLKLPPDYV